MMLPSCLLLFSCFVRAPSFREYVFICCGQIKWQGWCCAIQNALRAVEFNFLKLNLGWFCAQGSVLFELPLYYGADVNRSSVAVM
ncbi:unnamed protein product [Ixodes persulcatus]